MLKSGLASVLLAAAMATAACTPIAKTASLSAAFDNPPSYPGYEWTRNGKSVRYEELGASAGPSHCGWQSATILTIGWPLGTVSASAAQARFYIRDPKGIMGGSFKDRLIKDAHLPADARATGYKLGSIDLYLSPADQDDDAYLVTSAGAERWPRADPFYACA